MHSPRRLLLIVLSVVSVCGAGFLLLARGASTLGLRIDSSYILVSTDRVSRTEFAYTYRARVINAGSVDMLGVTATLTSHSPKTVVVDGDLTFGTVPAGVTVTSSDTFTIRQDRTVAFNPADLVWQISGMPVPRNTPPVANNDRANTDENIAVIINVVTNDTDTDGTIDITTVMIETRPSHGTVGVNGDGTVTYTPDPGFFGPDSFTYTAKDNAGARSNAATVTVKVQEVNDPPVANAGKDLHVETAMPVVLDGSASFDLNADMLTFSETIASLPGFGMAPEGHLSYSAGLNMRARRTQPCSVRGRIDPIPPKGLPRLQTCHRQRSSLLGAPTRAKPVRVVVTRPIGTSNTSGRCTTWGISTCGVRGISWSPIRSTTVRSAASTLTRTSLISHHPAVSILTV